MALQAAMIKAKDGGQGMFKHPGPLDDLAKSLPDEEEYTQACRLLRRLLALDQTDRPLADTVLRCPFLTSEEPAA